MVPNLNLTFALLLIFPLILNAQEQPTATEAQHPLFNQQVNFQKIDINGQLSEPKPHSQLDLEEEEAPVVVDDEESKVLEQELAKNKTNVVLLKKKKKQYHALANVLGKMSEEQTEYLSAKQEYNGLVDKFNVKAEGAVSNSAATDSPKWIALLREKLSDLKRCSHLTPKEGHVDVKISIRDKRIGAVSLSNATIDLSSPAKACLVSEIEQLSPLLAASDVTAAPTTVIQPIHFN